MSRATPAHAARVFDQRHAQPVPKLLWIVTPLFLLAPYFNAAGMMINGALLGMGLFVLFAPESSARSLRQSHVQLYGAFLMTSAFLSAFVAELYGGSNLVVIKLFASVTIYATFGYAAGLYFAKHGYDMNDTITALLRMTLAVVALNSVVIIAEYYLPPFRAVIESLMVHADTQIDYRTHDFRLRGLASAGGAGLSVFHGAGMWIALTLLKERKLSIGYFVLSVAVIVFSFLFTGRTGFVVLGLSVVLFVLTNLSGRNLRLLAVFVVSASVLVVVFARNLEELLPKAVLQYSLLFFLGGFAGLQEEGTVDMVGNFLFIPENPLHLLFGIGYFGGTNILGRPSDSGYVKLLLGFGLPLAVALYTSIIVHVRPLLERHRTRAFMLPLLIIMFLIEVKEPFLWQGYVSRLIFLLGGIGWAFRTTSSPTSA